MKVKGVGSGKLDRITGRSVANKAGSASSSGAASAGAKTGGSRVPKDDVALSSAGRVVAMASEAVHDAPDARSDRIQPIKDSIAAGRYDVASLRVADKILRQVLRDGRRNL